MTTAGHIGSWILAGLLFAYCGGAVVLYLIQDRMILFPDPGPDVAQVLAQPRPYNLEKWIVDGNSHGFVATPKGDLRGTVVAFHGNAGSAARHDYLALGMTSAGYRVVLAEYPGFGGRAGQASPPDMLAAAQADFELAQARWPGPILLVGESFGAGVAAQVAARHPDQTCGALLITPWDSLAALAADRFPFYPTRWLLKDPMDTVAALRNYPHLVVIVAALRDEVIGVEHARALRHALPGSARLIEIATGHADWSMTADWLAWSAPFKCTP